MAASVAASAALAPVVILVEPQMAENIGMVARAMLNCGLDELRLVRPKPRWPHPRAVAAASGADRVLDKARIFETVEAATADLNFVFASTVRPREMVMRVVTPERAVAEMRAHLARELGRPGVLFGREATGLENEEIVLADAILTVPTNPAYGSLNLAQAVFAVAHAWFRSGLEVEPSRLKMGPRARAATKDELYRLFAHLEGELDAGGFLRIKHKRPIMVRNLRAMFQRAGLTRSRVRRSSCWKMTTRTRRITAQRFWRSQLLRMRSASLARR